MPSRSCGRCGAPARAPFLAPPPEMAPDLDGRPGEPARSTLPRWVQVCPACNAAAPDLATLSPGDAGAPDAPDAFQRWAAAAEQTGDARAAAEAWLWAAWHADDAGDDPASRTARRRAASCWNSPDGPADALRLADVLRRAGDFAAAGRVLADTRPGDDEEAAILAFQRGRVAARDDRRHMLSSALRPPARRPHVSHKQQQRRSLWSRITGR